MNILDEYIYIKNNSLYIANNIYKLRKTSNIPECDMQEKFDEVFKIINYNIDIIEKLLQKNVDKLNITYNDEIESFFIDNNIKYKKLTQEEISNLVRCNRDDKIIPNMQQQNILDMIKAFYENNNIAKFYWSCGLGKALMSIFIVYEMKFLHLCTFKMPSFKCVKDILLIYILYLVIIK